MHLLVSLLLLVAADPAERSDVPALVSQLGADSRAERDAASAALDRIGGPALPALRSATRSGDAEIRRRARLLVERIESRLFREARQFAGVTGSVNGVTFSPDGRLAASADSRAVCLWDVATGRQLARVTDHRDRVMTVAFRADGKMLASGSEDRSVRLWDVPSLRPRGVLRGHTDAVRGLLFAADGKRLVSVGLDGRLCRWTLATGTAEAITAGRRWLSLGLLSADQVLPATPDNAAQQVYDFSSARPVVTLDGGPRPTLGVAVRRDGAQALGATGTKLTLWDLKANKILKILEGHPAQVICVAIAADGRYAASGGMDGVLRLWDLTEGTHLRGLSGHTGAIWSVALSADGRHALTGGTDGTLRLWVVGP